MRTKLITAAVLLAVLGTVSGCGDDKTTAQPSALVTPTAQPDGKYVPGTLSDQDAEAAVKAAVEVLPVAFSYDYRSLDASLAKATALMTPDFATKFSSTFTATTVPLATSKKAITSALVRAAGIVDSVKGDRVTCLVYLDQVLIASKDKKTSDLLKVSQNTVHVNLRKIDGKWMVDDIEPF